MKSLLILKDAIKHNNFGNKQKIKLKLKKDKFNGLTVILVKNKVEKIIISTHFRGSDKKTKKVALKFALRELIRKAL